MDYKETSRAVKLCGSTPKLEQCQDCPYWDGGNMSRCIPRMTTDAATAITDLLARAEAAEARAEKAEKCVAGIEEALKFGRVSAAMLQICEWRSQKEE